MEFFQNIILKQHSFGNNTILNDKNTFHIAFGIDANFTIGTGVLIYSILQQTNHNIIFHIFTDTIYDNDIERFKMLCEKYPNIVINIYYLNPQNSINSLLFIFGLKQFIIDFLLLIIYLILQILYYI